MPRPASDQISRGARDETSTWFSNSRPRPNCALKLFCFPYAGGSSLIYRDWPNLLPSNIHVISVELPGRGFRLKQTPFVNMPDLIDAVSRVIKPLLDMPYAFFGHSMGAMIAFELARRLKHEHAKEPELLVVSGRRAPQMPDNSPHSYDMPQEKLLSELQRIKGTPKEVLQNVELMELLLPLLRADFQLIQTYEYLPGERLDCPIRAYCGLEDEEETLETMKGWQEQTRSSFRLNTVPGDHFFLKSSQTYLIQMISRDLQEVITR